MPPPPLREVPFVEPVQQEFPREAAKKVHGGRSQKEEEKSPGRGDDASESDSAASPPGSQPKVHEPHGSVSSPKVNPQGTEAASSSGSQPTEPVPSEETVEGMIKAKKEPEEDFPPASQEGFVPDFEGPPELVDIDAPVEYRKAQRTKEKEQPEEEQEDTEMKEAEQPQEEEQDSFRDEMLEEVRAKKEENKKRSCVN